MTKKFPTILLKISSLLNNTNVFHLKLSFYVTSFFTRIHHFPMGVLINVSSSSCDFVCLFLYSGSQIINLSKSYPHIKMACNAFPIIPAKIIRYPFCNCSFKNDMVISIPVFTSPSFSIIPLNNSDILSWCFEIRSLVKIVLDL